MCGGQSLSGGSAYVGQGDMNIINSVYVTFGVTGYQVRIIIVIMVMLMVIVITITNDGDDDDDAHDDNDDAHRAAWA